MGNYYGSGLIGLDMKQKRKNRKRKNRFIGNHRWVLAAAIAIITLLLAVMSGFR